MIDDQFCAKYCDFCDFFYRQCCTGMCLYEYSTDDCDLGWGLLTPVPVPSQGGGGGQGS